MLQDGHIRLYRSITGWEWYTDINVKVLFLHLLLTVNYFDSNWKGIEIKRGQRVASYEILANETGLTVSQVRTAVGKLKRTGEIAHKPQAKYGLFTVLNYDSYQTHDRQNDSQAAGRSQGRRSQVATNKESNKAIRQENPPVCPPLRGEFQNVRLSEKEYDGLVQRMGKDGAVEYIERLSGWLAEGNSKKNHYATLLNWWRKDAPARKKSQGMAAYDLEAFQQMLDEEAAGQTKG